MNRLLLFVVPALLCACARIPRGSPGPSTFFVATNGNDAWSGTRSAPNWTRTDGPFATLPRALAAARRSKHQHPGAPQTILVRKGMYCLGEPLPLKPEDSGLTLAACHDEQPVLSGGRSITGWHPITVAGKPLWATHLPDVQAGRWYFRELWINGRRATRARYPNHGYLSIAGLPDTGSTWSQGQMRFRFRPGDLHAWPTATSAEVVVMNRWVESRLPIFVVDEPARLVNFSKRSVFQLDPGDLYYVEGAFELLDEPGEWYLDRAAGTLYYWPRPGESLQTVQAVAPALTQVLRFEGRPESGHFIDHVTLRGLTFSHTEWCFPDDFKRAKDKPAAWPGPKAEVGGFGQAAIGVPGAVWGSGLRDCLFENCAFVHLGDYALELTRGCQSNRILHCEFSDLGAGGIKLGETVLRKAPADLTRANQISDCRIHDGGFFFPSAVGIWLGQTPDNRITHNLIHDFYYTGISIGWTWGYGPALATNNFVAFNLVHHIGKKSNGDGPILSDMGGIYTLGRQPGTTILNNLWHDIAGFRYGGWGIYFDEGSSGILASSNVVYRTTHGGFHQHYGATNLVQNNIFAFARDHQLQRTRPEPHLSFSFQTNLVYYDSGVLLGGNWSGDQFHLDWNLYFDARPGATPDQVRFAGMTLGQWRTHGHDLHSILADPLFVAPRQHDFRLRPGSPALKLGFQPIDLSQVGPRK